MNSYRGPTIGAPSKATPSTLCQKCLKRGHYSYECKAVAQERPYVSRPSRTQQLFNPKLVPKLTNDAPQDLPGKSKPEEPLGKKHIGDDRGRKRDRDSHDDRQGQPKRLRSASTRSSVSVSTVSTNASRSPPTNKDRKRDQRRRISPLGSRDEEPWPSWDEQERGSNNRSKGDVKISNSRGRRRGRSRSRGSYSSASTSKSRSPRRDLSGDANIPPRRHRARSRSRSRTPLRQRRYSPGRDDEQVKPLGGTNRTEHVYDRRDMGEVREFNGRNDTRPHRENQTEAAPRKRSPSPRRTRVERSLSPFSQRVALTKALGR